jgi:16S rRNA (adenine1518-N6/adenine1519-N6)-dimethyltransferase
LDKLGHFPKRFLGQNFLVDGNIVRKSLELAAIASCDRVVEIGPGLGTLTSALLEAGAQVWAVEKDETLAKHLTETLCVAHPDRFHLTVGDAIDLPLANLPASEAAAGFKVVANLPYAISTPWMDAVLSGPLPLRMVLMLQQEAAQRYAASPGSKQFSAISIFLQAAYDIAPGHKVAAACFHPRPDIESYLLHLVRKRTPVLFTPETKALIRSCFQQRRKQIGALLRDRRRDGGAGWLAHFEAAGLDHRARPEDIPISLWLKLSPA